MSSRRRSWRSVAAAALAVTACAVSLGARPLTAMAQPPTTTLWGIDSCDAAQSVVPATQQAQMGNPQFVGRYLDPSTCDTPDLSTAEVAYLESMGIGILLISDPGRFDQSNPGGAAEAQAAILEAQALGAPRGTAIFRDVEVSDTITAAYIESWYQTFAHSSSGYVPGFYENSYNTTSGYFAGTSGAYCTAESADPAIATGVVLWTDELEEPWFGDPTYFPTSANAPGWSPFALPCANNTVAWQYEVNSGFPTNNTDPDVDVDEFLDQDANLLWSGGAYTPLTPYRVCDTRQGTGTPCSGTATDNTIGPGQSLSLAVTGISGSAGETVPAGAQAVALNVTAIAGTAATYLTVYPAGSSPPTASTLNVTAGVIQANLAVVPLGSAGEVSIYNHAGAINVAVDVEGYFGVPSAAGPNVAGLFHPIAPLRVCDTRAGTGTACSGAPLGAGEWTEVTVSGLPSGAAPGTASVPADGTAAAVVLNLTAVLGTAATYLSVVPPNGNGTCPSSAAPSSNLNVLAQTIVPNRVIVPLGPAQDVCVYNHLGIIDIVLDVNGWFGTGTETTKGAYFHAVSPLRICDTRSAFAMGYSTECSGSTADNLIGPGQNLPVAVAGVDGLPGAAGSLEQPVAVIANITAVSGTAPTFLTAYPANVPLPTASDLNVGTGQVTPNMVIVQLAPGGSQPGAFDLYNHTGSIDAVVDVEGWFE